MANTTDIVALIDKSLDVVKVLEYYNLEFDDTSQIIRMACPLHNGDNPTSFVINQDNGLWKCYSEDISGSIIHFVERMESINFTKAVERLCQILNVNKDNAEIIEEHVKEARKFVRNKKSKETKKNHAWKPDCKIKVMNHYRNFTKETMKHFKAGYVEQLKTKNKKGEDCTIKNKLGILLYEDNKIVGISLRRMNENDNVKWLHLPANLQTKTLIYNMDACKEYDEIIITEGIFDVWAYHQAGIKNVVCTFGAHLTKNQYKILMKCGKDITLSYDGDKAGQAITKKVSNMFKNKVNINVVGFKEDEDPASVDSEALIQKYKNKQQI